MFSVFIGLVCIDVNDSGSFDYTPSALMRLRVNVLPFNDAFNFVI